MSVSVCLECVGWGGIGILSGIPLKPVDGGGGRWQPMDNRQDAKR